MKKLIVLPTSKKNSLGIIAKTLIYKNIYFFGVGNGEIVFHVVEDFEDFRHEICEALSNVEHDVIYYENIHNGKL